MPSSSKPTTVIVMRHGGSHLILPMVKRLTGKAIYRPKGQEALVCEPSGHLVIFARNPRNRLVSFYRWKRGMLPADEELAAFMVRPKRDGEKSPLQFAQAWAARWMRHEGGHRLRFEDLVDPTSGPHEIARLAEFLGVNADSEAYAAVVGKGTFTGRHSDWRTVFGPESLRTYRKNGGDELDRLMGYDND